MDNQHKPKTSPYDFFLHIGVIATLYVSAISLLNLIFNTINVAFPDALDYNYGDPYSGALRLAIAALVIVFPLYIFMSWLLNRDYVRAPEKRELGIRKWLTYFTLFVAGVVIATDLIVLVYVFLNGEVTIRFMLKVLATFGLSAAVFGYYIADIRASQGLGGNIKKISAIAAIVVVLAAIVAGFLIIGSPQKARLARFDDLKTNDLMSLQYQVANFWQNKGRLPVTLEEMNDPIASHIVPVDPQYGTPYDYAALGAMKFKICAEFNLPSDDRQMQYSMAPQMNGKAPDSWKHAAGQACFERTIDPDLYPPTKR